MILLTGATGVIGSALLQRLVGDGDEVRCLVRDPRRLGPNRVRVQITLGDLANPVALRQAVRGVRAVVHLAAAIRDQREGTIEELNGLATARLLRYAESAGVERFVYFGALGATPSSRTRFFRAKALAEHAVAASPIDATVLSPSIVYAPADPFMALLRRLSWLPWMPISGTGRARFQPMWAEDAAECALHALRGGSPDGARRLELAGPEVLSYEEIVRLALDGLGSPAAAAPRAAGGRPPGPRRGRAAGGHVGVRHLGGGRADGGPHDDAARQRGRPPAGCHAANDGAGAGPRRLAGKQLPRPSGGGRSGPAAEFLAGPSPGGPLPRRLPAALVEVELGERCAGDVGGHLLGDLQVPGPHRDVVERHDADQALAFHDRRRRMR